MSKTKHDDVATATVFTCGSVGAKSVYLAGTFNDWNPETIPMTRSEDDIWKVALDLAPGQYEYKFVVDGNWCCEPGREDWSGCPDCVRNDAGTLECTTCVANPFGTMNRVLEVGARHAAGAGRAA